MLQQAAGVRSVGVETLACPAAQRRWHARGSPPPGRAKPLTLCIAPCQQSRSVDTAQRSHSSNVTGVKKENVGSPNVRSIRNTSDKPSPRRPPPLPSFPALAIGQQWQTRPKFRSLQNESGKHMRKDGQQSRHRNDRSSWQALILLRMGTRPAGFQLHKRSGNEKPHSAQTEGRSSCRSKTKVIQRIW